ncbi:hypothetical protein M902_1950 [Bacteriovorax sp. BAL6_X]|uniref:hypothetical protein n=1 Tax=Bacteriovorax sp. BAL6_X TaxID=1201290 RepID=UPI000386680D|nr:hypothetical protein [Bacteriovorax sp. BAL6_X]EPZ51711.1 hypothetical protein M902_1950 [Bacteriovorax sp. BAL6_X]
MATYALVLLTFLFSLTTNASSCCGGGANIPNIILGDHQWEAKINYANSAVTSEAGVDGKIHNINSKNEVTETIAFKGSYLIDSYFQIAFDIPVKKRTVESSIKETSTTEMVDPSFQFTWEFLPELTYNLLKPRGFLFFKQLIPNGNSIYSYDDPLLSDSLSRGVYESTLGLALFKVVYDYDYSVTLEGHYGFKRTIDNKEVEPGFGYSSSLGLGYNPSATMRFGTSLTYWQDSAVKIDGNEGENKYYLSTNFNYSYMFTRSSLVLNYSDETILNVAKNTNLAKAISLTYKVFEDL